MTDEVNQSPASPMEGSPPLETNPLATIHLSVEEKTNIMTLEELDALREAYSFPPRVRVRLPEEGKTITYARPSEVAFYEAAFPVGLRFSLHPTIKLILQFYNIFPAQLSLMLGEARNKKTLPGGYPNNVKGWKSKFFFVSGDEWELPKGSPLEGASRVPRAGGALLCTSAARVEVVLPHIRFSGSMASGTIGKSHPSGEAPSSSGDVGVVIGEKRTEESLAYSASKKGKVNDGSKGKRVDREPKGKKKATSSSKASTTPATVSSRPEEGTSANLGAILGPTASILGSPSVAEKLLRSSLAVWSREAGEQASFQEGRAASMETEVAHLQKLSADLEQQLAKARVCEQQANDELAKTKSDRDSLANKVERSRVLVVELREALGKAKESAVEEFKSSSEFVVAVEDSASRYFGEGFDFCKVQLCQHHPNLAIDLEGTMVDQDLLAEQDEAAEEKKKEKFGENEEVKKIPPLF
ncbi:hypothetical protein Acr_10g0008680 [Actinidia rufa]|uniref:Uncharacterized protein n=1 Tax=Actinidia rufa TaxID=165716 RepID=A0A7J0FA39_9ERIC|nr:hypothetical protein Acr_10g0008680 [Actinidia rufa]